MDKDFSRDGIASNKDADQEIDRGNRQPLPDKNLGAVRALLLRWLICAATKTNTDSSTRPMTVNLEVCMIGHSASGNLV